jgi:hypothetical protein
MKLSSNSLAAATVAFFTLCTPAGAQIAPVVAFKDTFTRPDGQTLGTPEVGGAWTEFNELYSAIYRPARGTVQPADITLENNALNFHYVEYFGNAQPVAYAALTTPALTNAVIEFDLMPPPPQPNMWSGRISHEVGLMTASEGFSTGSLVPADYGAQIPKKGLTVSISRSSYDYSNSNLALLKSDGTNLVSMASTPLPFQLNFGAVYHYKLVIADDTFAVTVSNGAESFTHSVPLNGFTFLGDQLVVLDDQGGGNGIKYDNFLVTVANIRSVNIDIKPDDTTNSVNLTSSGVVPVAILSNAGFDATQVDPSTVTLAGAQVKLIARGTQYSCGPQDVNQDGRLDLLCHISTNQMSIEAGVSSAVLEAKTLTGQVVRGEDSINIVNQ